MSEYPKALYGPAGWNALADMVTVNNDDEEAQARKDGYKMLSEDSADVPKRGRGR